MKQKGYIKKFIVLLLSIFVIFSSLPGQVWASGVKIVSYLDGDQIKTHEVTVMQEIMTTGWYATLGPGFIFDPCVVIQGDVDLILIDGTNTVCFDGIYITEGSTLTIWAQSTDKKTMGKLQPIRSTNQ